MLDPNSNSRPSGETLSFATSDSSGASGSLLLSFPHVTIVRVLTLTTRKDAMGGQRTLFMEMQQGLLEGEPRGFRYREQIIGEGEEVALAAELEKLALKPFEFHGYFGNRRVVNFGLKYDFSRWSVEKADDMPSFLDDLLSRAAHFAGCQKDAFRQVGVNEYRAGAGIGRIGNTAFRHSTHCDISITFRTLSGI
jgi:hypothetical protein